MLFGGPGQRSHARASQPESLAIPDSIVRRCQFAPKRYH
jgi:hypothetical protein